MSNEHLLCTPHRIKGRKDAWWYEEADGICLVIEPQPKTEQITTPWSEIRIMMLRTYT